MVFALNMERLISHRRPAPR